MDGSRSWTAADEIARFEWTFGDGTTETGSQVERTFEKPGTYSEILKVVDTMGRIGYDFAAVQVIDRRRLERLPPTIHASYAPTFGIHAGDPVTFKVRTFRVKAGNETWNFGDETAPVTVHSDGNTNPSAADGYAETAHRFAKPGRYIVRVEGTADDDATAVAHLQVDVDEDAFSRAEPGAKPSVVPLLAAVVGPSIVAKPTDRTILPAASPHVVPAAA